VLRDMQELHQSCNAESYAGRSGINSCRVDASIFDKDVINQSRDSGTNVITPVSVLYSMSGFYDLIRATLVLASIFDC